MFNVVIYNTVKVQLMYKEPIIDNYKVFGNGNFSLLSFMSHSMSQFLTLVKMILSEIH